MAHSKVCLIGGGNIAAVHAEALGMLESLELVGLVEPNQARAEAFAKRYGIPKTFTRLEEALEEGPSWRYHLLTPPHLHYPLAKTLLDRGCDLLVEKPIAETRAESDELVLLAREKNAILGVNQNFIFNPAFARLLREVEDGKLGRLNSVACCYHMPLRQLAAGQLGHWMFQKPLNLLLEQAVHPLSQILRLTGPVCEVSALADAPFQLGDGRSLRDGVNVSLSTATCPANLHFSVGRSFAHWTITALCDDGVMIADVLRNRCQTIRPSQWMEFADNMVSGLSQAGQLAWGGLSEGAGYLLATAKVLPRSDPFFRSVRASVEAYHSAADARQEPAHSGAFGLSILEACEAIATSAWGKSALKASTPPKKAQRGRTTYDVLLIGGTGFIGRYCVEALLAAGLTVGVMARGLNNLPPVYGTAGVSLIQGDATREEDLRAAIASADRVVNLAHGGGGETWEEIESAMVASALKVARLCQEAGVKRLIHVGSIAGLYLGDPQETITGSTAPDPRRRERALYARGKAEADIELMAEQRKSGLPLVILRPGLVVGDGTSPLHSGVGFFNSETHCLGWSRGNNPLPFVLVEDVAQAIQLCLETPGLEGKAYNLVGDVRPSARKYIRALARALDRPLVYHGHSLAKLYGLELLKWAVKRAAGRKVAVPSARDFRSRGLFAQFDCSDCKQDFGWKPESDWLVFEDKALNIHRDPRMG